MIIDASGNRHNPSGVVGPGQFAGRALPTSQVTLGEIPSSTGSDSYGDYATLDALVADGHYRMIDTADGLTTAIQVVSQPTAGVFGDEEGDDVWTFRGIKDQGDGTWQVVDVTYGATWPYDETFKSPTEDEIEWADEDGDFLLSGGAFGNPGCDTCGEKDAVVKVRGKYLCADDEAMPVLSRLVDTWTCTDPMNPVDTNIKRDTAYSDHRGYLPGRGRSEAIAEVKAIVDTPENFDSDIFG